MAEIVKELIDSTEEFVSEKETLHKRPWQKWIDAELGFRNYWYIGALSGQVPEGGVKTVQMLGEDILLTRRGGEVYAIEDRCCHRGARISKRPFFFSKDTVTCWYHTFTFNLDDGRIRCILNEPNSKLVGKVGIKSYPVEEVKGIIFVFIGDIDPPKLACDMPPGFLDDNVALYAAEPREVKANWRLGCENGFDPGHTFVHNWSKFPIMLGLPMTFGIVASKEEIADVTTYYDTEPGPKGFTRKIFEASAAFETTIPGRNGEKDVTVTLPCAKGKTPEELFAKLGSVYDIGEVSLWLPCGLKVTHFPTPPIVDFEFYVPKDEETHSYFQFGGKPVQTEEEYEAWVKEDGRIFWEIPTVESFTTEDAFAREGIQKFYGQEDGWYRERLYQPDLEITIWRKFASQHTRGVQTREHAKGNFKRG